LPGSQDIKRLGELFSSLSWWTLRPAQHCLAFQPGDVDARRFISISAGDKFAIAYLPHGGAIQLNLDRIAGMHAQWFNPRTAERTNAEVVAGRVSAHNDEDWILLLQK
jgi:collagenase-like protein with putative collagen-binding domain